nr:hypothetical protein [uncultured Methanomethylovorans sp.]
MEDENVFGKKMEFALVFDDLINLFCEAYTCLAVSIMISCLYIIVQSALCFAYSHMGKYVLYSLVVPFRDVPVLGGVIEAYIDHLISQDTQAYNAFMASSF